jgi:hypothetical protein
LLHRHFHSNDSALLRHKSIVIQTLLFPRYPIELFRYYGNATGCIGHATKETQHVTIYIYIYIYI